MGRFLLALVVVLGGCRTRLLDEEVDLGEVTRDLALPVVHDMAPLPPQRIRWNVWASGTESCARAAGGAVWCWGAGLGTGGGGVDASSSGDLTRGSVPARAPDYQGLADLRDGCTLFDNGRAFCATVVLDTGDPGAPQEISPDAVAIAKGGGAPCVLSAASVVRCYGDGIGAGIPVALHHPIGIAGGADGLTAALADGSVSWWYGNGWGVTRVPGLTSAIQVTMGIEHSCALLADGTVSCWGSFKSGHPTVPKPVPGVSGAVQIDGGSWHDCALISDGTVRCWGLNDHGQIGDGTHDYQSDPVAVRGLDHVVALRLGSRHTCAARADGAIFCWGMNSDGQLGDGTAEDSSVPVRVRF